MIMTKCHSIRQQTPKFPIPQKSYATFFLGHFLGYPPKMHYNAVQCIEVQTLELFTPDGSNMTHNDPG